MGVRHGTSIQTSTDNIVRDLNYNIQNYPLKQSFIFYKNRNRYFHYQNPQIISAERVQMLCHVKGNLFLRATYATFLYDLVVKSGQEP